MKFLFFYPKIMMKKLPLKNAGILNAMYYPDMPELRGNILLMLWNSIGK
jgi:hypothetical protein